MDFRLFLRKPVQLALSAMLLAAAGVGGTAGAQAPNQAALPQVEVLEVSSGSASIVSSMAGRVSANKVAPIRPQVSGMLKKRYFTEGSMVNEGDLLYQIEDAVFQASFEHAKAVEAKAQARVNSLQDTVTRYEALSKIKAASQQDLENYQLDLTLALADLGAAKTSLDLALIDLEYTKIHAPISGVIGASSITEGALLTANQANPLAIIQTIDPVYVDLIESSAKLTKRKNAIIQGNLKASQSASVKLFLEDGSVYPLTGVLHFEDASVNPATGTVLLRAEFPNPHNLLLPGMYVQAEVEEGAVENSYLIPQSAMSRNTEGTGVVLTLSNGIVEQKEVVAPHTLKDQWVVTKGLTEGDLVITKGLQKVRPGSPASASSPAAQ